MSKLKCGCERKPRKWFFHWDGEKKQKRADEKFAKRVDDLINSTFKEVKKKYKDATPMLMLMNLERQKAASEWFLNCISKMANKKCIGWAFEMPCLYVNNKCKIHSKGVEK